MQRFSVLSLFTLIHVLRYKTDAFLADTELQRRQSAYGDLYPVGMLAFKTWTAADGRMFLQARILKGTELRSIVYGDLEPGI